MLSCSFGTADSHKSSSCLHGHQHELCKHEEFSNWILLVIELCHLPNGARDTDFWVATRGAHLLMPVTRPLLNFATSCCGEICSSWASEQLPQQQRALILTSRAKQFCFGRMHSTCMWVRETSNTRGRVWPPTGRSAWKIHGHYKKRECRRMNPLCIGNC